MKKKYIYRSYIFMCLLSMSVLLSGCEQEVRAPVEIIIGVNEQPLRIDPQLAFDSASITIINSIFEGLYRKDKNGIPIPAAAHSCDVSNDGLTYTFNLRDTKWADGKSVEAGHFKIAWQRSLRPNRNNEEPAYLGDMLFCIEGAENYALNGGSFDEVGIQVKDSKTLIVKLTKPTPHFLELICNSVFMPINPEFYDKQPVVNNIKNYGTNDLAILGNGAYILREWDEDGMIVLQKNEKYWDIDKIHIDKITLNVEEDKKEAIKKFENGILAATDISLEQIQDCQDAGIDMKDNYDNSVHYLDFNIKSGVLENPDIRKALSLSLDREMLTQMLSNSEASPAYGFVSPAIYGVNASFREEAGQLFNVANNVEAQKLLGNGLKTLNLVRIPTITILVEDSEQSKNDAKLFISMWKRNLGIDVKLKQVKYENYINQIEQGEYEIAYLAWSLGYDDPTGYLEKYISHNPKNNSGYENNRYDELLASSNTEKDRSKRIEILIEAEKVLINDDMTLCPLYFTKKTYIVQPGLKGLIRRGSSLYNMDFYWARMN